MARTSEEISQRHASDGTSDTIIRDPQEEHRCTTVNKALRKNIPVTSEALAAFVAQRRACFGVDDPAGGGAAAEVNVAKYDEDDIRRTGGDVVGSGVSGVSGVVTGTLRRLVKHQTDALERALRSRREGGSRSRSLGGVVPPAEDDVFPSSDETLDVLFRRRLLLLQARRGYRCNVDSLVLAAHVAAGDGWRRASERPRDDVDLDESEAAASKRKERRIRPRPPVVADLGAGNGVIGISLALRRADAEVLCVEQQPSLAARCARNASLNGVHDRVRVWRGDLRRIYRSREGGRSFGGGAEEEEDHSRDVDASGAVDPRVEAWMGRCDAVVCNPPYFPMDLQRASGTPPELNERRLAHYETTAGLTEFAAAAAALLSSDGSLHVVYPADRADTVYAAVTAAGLGRIASRRVYHDEGSASRGEAATLVLVDARRPLPQSPPPPPGGGRPMAEGHAEGHAAGREGTATNGSGDADAQPAPRPGWIVRERPPLILYAGEGRGARGETQTTYCEEVEAFMRHLPAPGP